jgi:hypothetical protein
VAVDPSLRGQGIGRALMGAVLERADGLESVRLYQEAFNAASFTLYYSLDFLPAAVLLDLFRPSRNTCGDQSQPGVRCATIADLDSLLRYDTPRSNYDRRVDLTFYLRWGQVLVLEHGAVIDGYLACLPTAESVQFGPLVAHSEAAAQCLFQHAIPLYPDRIQQTRIMARDQRLAAALRRAGFRLYCVDLLMVRGAWRPGRCVEAFGRFPEGI